MIMDDQTPASSGVSFFEEADENDCCASFCRTVCGQKRIILAAMGFWCFFVLSALRLNISLAIVAMVNWSEIQDNHSFNRFSNDSCHYDEKEERPDKEDGPFSWSPAVQGHILGSYFYGLAATQLLGGRLSELFSAKWVLFIGNSVATLSTLLAPVAASNDPFALIILQVCKGFGQGVLMPSFSILMSKWIPPTERVRFMACITSGIPIGGFVTFILSGTIINSFGWKYVFYIFGAVGGTWCYFWSILIYDSPFMHPHITSRELNQIMSLRSQKVPILHLKSILKSKPVWAFILVGFASFWSYNLYVSVVPLFMGTVLKFNIEKNGLLSAVPNLVEAFSLICTSLISDYLLKKKILAVTAIRKIFITTGLSGVAVCLISVTFTGCNRTLSVFFLVAALGMCGFNMASITVVPVDMSPRFAGTISGTMSTFGAFSGVIIPAAIGYLTRKRQTLDEWTIIFYISAAICISAAVIFLIFGSSEIQPWNSSSQINFTESEGQAVDSVNIRKESSSSCKDIINISFDKPGPSTDAPCTRKQSKENGMTEEFEERAETGIWTDVQPVCSSCSFSFK